MQSAIGTVFVGHYFLQNGVRHLASGFRHLASGVRHLASGFRQITKLGFDAPLKNLISQFSDLIASSYYRSLCSFV
jgi:hypothetical protein